MRKLGAAVLFVLSISVDAQAAASGRNLPIGPKVPYASFDSGLWKATAIVAPGLGAPGSELGGVYCAVRSRGFEFLQFLIPYDPIRLDFLGDASAPNLSLHSIQEVRLGGLRYEAQWIDSNRHLREVDAPNGGSQLELEGVITTAPPAGYLGVRRDAKLPWAPFEHLLDEMVTQETMELGYVEDWSDESLDDRGSDKPTYRLAHTAVDLKGLGPALRWCQESLTSNSWLPHVKKLVETR